MGPEPGFRYTFRSTRSETELIIVEFLPVSESDLKEYQLRVVEPRIMELPPRLRKQLDALKKAPFVGNIGMVQNGLWSIMHDFDEHGWKMSCLPLKDEVSEG